MYKNKITLWRLDKKLKDKDVKAIIRHKRKRDAIGKPSAFRVRGQVLNSARVTAHLKRKGMTEDDISSAARSPASSDLSCFTPEMVPSTPPSAVERRSPISAERQLVSYCPSPRLVAAPESLGVPERIFKDINTYYTQSFMIGKWYHSAFRTLHFKSFGPASVEMSLLTTACYLLSPASTTGDRSIRGGTYLQQDFIFWEHMLRREAP